MPAAPLTIALLVSLATVAGTITVALEPAPLSSETALMFGAGMVIITVIAAAGILLARSRWARVPGSAVPATWVAVGIALDTSAGLAIITLGVVALAAVLGPWLRRWLRRLPRADGPPPSAAALLLTLTASPALLGLSSWSQSPEPAAWGLAAWSLLLALGVARLVPGSLVGLRVLHPALGVLTAVLVEPLPAAVALLTSATSAALAWRREVRVALVPVEPARGEAVRFPPELTPHEVLKAAGIDPTGRPERDRESGNT